jgi:hypothetical protein
MSNNKKYYDIKQDDEKGLYRITVEYDWRKQHMTTNDWDIFMDLVACVSLQWPQCIWGIYEGNKPMDEDKINDLYEQIRERYGVGRMIVE